MALDEAFLEAVGRIGHPVLRFYAWTAPAATFGYFQKSAEVERMTTLRPLIRRPTGGGLVPHDADWTYSLVFPPSHSWYGLPAVVSYRRLHEWLQAAFARLGLATQLSSASINNLPGQCFAGPVRHDLLWEGRKIAGAAQRRNRLGLLIQGSVQPPPLIPRSAWEQAVAAIARDQWGVRWELFRLETALRERALALAVQKYSQRNYNERR